MGTLGCINDMLQRDKENRELRKLSKGNPKQAHENREQYQTTRYIR